MPDLKHMWMVKASESIENLEVAKTTVDKFGINRYYQDLANPNLTFTEKMELLAKPVPKNPVPLMHSHIASFENNKKQQEEE